MPLEKNLSFYKKKKKKKFVGKSHAAVALANEEAVMALVPGRCFVTSSAVCPRCPPCCVQRESGSASLIFVSVPGLGSLHGFSFIFQDK